VSARLDDITQGALAEHDAMRACLYIVEACSLARAAAGASGCEEEAEEDGEEEDYGDDQPVSKQRWRQADKHTDKRSRQRK
jgi:hypothetical protein